MPQPGLFGPTRKPCDQRLVAAVALLEEIIVVDGVDAGVILKSSESPSRWDKEAGCHIMQHEYFSDLGDNLIKLYYLLLDEPQPHEVKREI